MSNARELNANRICSLYSFNYIPTDVCQFNTVTKELMSEYTNSVVERSKIDIDYLDFRMLEAQIFVKKILYCIDKKSQV